MSIECDFFDYTTQVSQAAFPTEWFYNLSRIYAVRYPDVAKRISKISSYKDAKKYYLAFNIYYKDLTYQLIQETPYWTTFALFSNIGGNLGLFVGMSFLTFVEVVDLFVKFGDFLISYFYKHIKASISPTN